jgi:hypothetical protein
MNRVIDALAELTGKRRKSALMEIASTSDRYLFLANTFHRNKAEIGNITKIRS